MRAARPGKDVDMGKTRSIGVRFTDAGGRGPLLPYDMESGEYLANVVSCTLHSEIDNVIRADITLYIDELPDPERTCLQAGAKAPTAGCACSGCEPK